MHGLNTSLPNARDHDAIVEFALNFAPEIYKDGGAVYKVRVFDYSLLKNMPVISPLRDRHQQDVLARLAQFHAIVNTQLDNVAHIFSRVDEFDLDSVKIAALEATEASIIGTLSDLSTAAEDCYINSANCIMPSAALIYFDLPDRVADLATTGACRLSGSNERFVTLNGGCTDIDTGVIWSSQASGTRNLEDASAYCISLSESGAGDWILPSAEDLRRLAGMAEIIVDVKNDYRDWYWSSDAKRVNIVYGNEARFNTDFELSTVCRRI